MSLIVECWDEVLGHVLGHVQENIRWIYCISTGVGDKGGRIAMSVGFHSIQSKANPFL